MTTAVASAILLGNHHSRPNRRIAVATNAQGGISARRTSMFVISKKPKDTARKTTARETLAVARGEEERITMMCSSWRHDR